jgi:hypothetical protein
MRPERAGVEIPYRKVSGALCVEVREGGSRNGRKKGIDDCDDSKHEVDGCSYAYLGPERS